MMYVFGKLLSLGVVSVALIIGVFCIDIIDVIFHFVIY